MCVLLNVRKNDRQYNNCTHYWYELYLNTYRQQLLVPFGRLVLSPLFGPPCFQYAARGAGWDTDGKKIRSSGSSSSSGGSGAGGLHGDDDEDSDGDDASYLRDNRTYVLQVCRGVAVHTVC